MNFREKIAILFDKDGTLMQFTPFWVPVAKAAIRRMVLSHAFGHENLSDMISAAEKAIGIEGDGLLSDGILLGGTYGQTADAIGDVLRRFGVMCDITREETVAAFETGLSEGKIVPVCENLREKLKRAKRAGIHLFLVTTDNPQITDRCLRALRIRDLFDSVFCDDGFRPAKPSPLIAEEILRLYQWKAADLCMVGDTVTDMKFAKNAGIAAICVGDNETAREMADDGFTDAGVFLDSLFSSEKEAATA